MENNIAPERLKEQILIHLTEYRPIGEWKTLFQYLSDTYGDDLRVRLYENDYMFGPRFVLVDENHCFDPDKNICDVYPKEAESLLDHVKKTLKIISYNQEKT